MVSAQAGLVGQLDAATSDHAAETSRQREQVAHLEATLRDRDAASDDAAAALRAEVAALELQVRDAAAAGGADGLRDLVAKLRVGGRRADARVAELEGDLARAEDEAARLRAAGGAGAGGAGDAAGLRREVEVLEAALARAAEEAHALETAALAGAPAAPALRAAGLRGVARGLGRWARRRRGAALRAWAAAARRRAPPAPAPGGGAPPLDVSTIHSKIRSIRVADRKSALADMLHATELLHHAAARNQEEARQLA